MPTPYILYVLCGNAFLLLAGLLSFAPLRAHVAVNLALNVAEHRHALYVLLASHSRNDTFEIYKKLRRDLGKKNVFLLYDDTVAPWEFGPGSRLYGYGNTHSSKLDYVYFFNATEARAQLSNFPVGDNIDGESDIPDFVEYWQETTLVAFYENHLRNSPIKFDYLWTFEADLRCNGRYDQCLAPTVDQKEDLLCLDIRQFRNDSDWEWPHWWKLQGAIDSVPYTSRMKCFMPLRRFSRAALDILSTELVRSRGYCEIFIPTLFTTFGLNLGTIDERSIGLVEYRGKAETVLNEATCLDNRFYHPYKLENNSAGIKTESFSQCDF